MVMLLWSLVRFSGVVWGSSFRMASRSSMISMGVMSPVAHCKYYLLMRKVIQYPTCLIIHTASSPPRNPLAMPVPVGQKGSSSPSPTRPSRSCFWFFSMTWDANPAANIEVKSNSATSGSPWWLRANSRCGS